MLKSFQHTLNEPVSFEGIGLHTGKKVKIRVFPGDNDQGIIFKRTDLKDKNLIVAKYSNVSSAKLCTTLQNSFGISVFDSDIIYLNQTNYLSETKLLFILKIHITQFH